MSSIFNTLFGHGSKKSFLKNVNYRNISLVELNELFVSGADVNENLKLSGDTPLMLAIRECTNSDIINEMIAKGAKVNTKNNNGWTALMDASMCNENPEIIKLLINKGAKINEANYNMGMTPLLLAAKSNNNPDIITTLINYGADINAVSHENLSALMYSIINRNSIKIAPVIIKAGCDIEYESDLGWSALLLASTNEYNPVPELIELLVDNGADVNRPASVGEKTALLLAAKYHQPIEIFKKLIELGANVNYQDPYGCTPLMAVAVDHDNPDIVKLLIDNGADISIKDIRGLTAYDYMNTLPNKIIVNSYAKSLLR